MVAYFRRVAAFSDIQQHGEISMIHFIFIFIWFLPCLFWCYPLFQCVYKSSTLFLYFCLPVLLNIMSSCPVYPYFYWKHNWMCVLNISVWWNVFEKFLRTKLFLVKFETFPFQAFIFQAILPGILLPNLQSRHFPWPVIQKTTDFSERG